MTHDEEKKVADIIAEMAAAIESLQRENEELRKGMQTNAKRLRDANAAFERERKFHLENQELNRKLEARAEAAEAEVKRLREALSIINAGHGCPMAVAEDALRSQALASTGGEHHGK